jgi:hypothetical protein
MTITALERSALYVDQNMPFSVAGRDPSRSVPVEPADMIGSVKNKGKHPQHSIEVTRIPSSTEPANSFGIFLQHKASGQKYTANVRFDSEEKALAYTPDHAAGHSVIIPHFIPQDQHSFELKFIQTQNMQLPAPERGYKLLPVDAVAAVRETYKDFQGGDVPEETYQKWETTLQEDGDYVHRIKSIEEGEHEQRHVISEKIPAEIRNAIGEQAQFNIPYNLANDMAPMPKNLYAEIRDFLHNKLVL